MTARMIAAGVAFLGATVVATATPKDAPVVAVRELEGGGLHRQRPVQRP